jgi:hypothetical protein
VKGDMDGRFSLTAGVPVAGEAAAEAGTDAAETTETTDLVGRWVALFDEAEALLAAAVADPDDSTASRLHRAASWALDTLSTSEHAMTPDARRQAREYVWRRDHAEAELLPNEVVLRRWEQCLCRRCHAARVLGHPIGAVPLAPSASAAVERAAATLLPPTPPSPLGTPGRRTRAVQAALFPATTHSPRRASAALGHIGLAHRFGS